MAIHAIGDAANAQVISTFESARPDTIGRPPLAHRAFPDRRPRRHSAPRAGRHHRLDAAGPPDQRPADGREAARTGSARRAPMPGRAVIRSGARIAFGSDFPVESPNPFPGLAAAVSRQDMNGQPPGGWLPEATRKLRAGPVRLHPRRRLRRLRRAEDRIAGARQMGRLHHRRPRRQRSRSAGARPNAGPGNMGRREEGVERCG